MDDDSDVVAWARAHRVCFQVGPLVEARGEARMQVGYAVDLYAALPMEIAAGAERREEASRIWKRLKTIVDSLIPPDGSAARVEIEPGRAAAYFRPENEMAPEIGLRARVFHRENYFTPVTTEERERLSAVERKLIAMGLRSGHW